MFLCSSCEYGSPTKLGKCPSCGNFGTFSQHITLESPKLKKAKNKSETIFYANPKQSQTRVLQEKEFQRIFGNGLQSGGVYLIAGEPGIGKSTFMLQLIQDINDSLSIGYFSGEEHEQHIKTRQARVSPTLGENLSVIHSNNLEKICEQGSEYDLIIVDSIQTIQSNILEAQSGSPAQVRYCADQLVQMAKQSNTTVLIIGHVTKGGEIAGPKYLEHIVDMVCYLEGDRQGEYRFLRTKKNRFGSTDETAIFHMEQQGLKPVSHIPLAEHSHDAMVYSIGIDNGRASMLQIELLLSKMKGKYPLRVCLGIDGSRLDMIIAIIEKYGKINLSFSDIFINIPGEVEYKDSGLDLAIALALYYQYKNLLIPAHAVFMGELGLGGQIIIPRQSSKRITEIPNTRSSHDWRSCKHIKNILS